MSISNNNARIVITTSKEVKEKLEKLAIKEDRSLSNYISVILKNIVNNSEE